MVLKKCDICGKTAQLGDKNFFIVTVQKEPASNEFDYFDVCKECKEQLTQLLKF